MGSQWGDEPVKHVGKKRVRISGRFFPDVANPVDNTKNVGKKGWTVAYGGSAGLFVLTLEQHWLKYVLLGTGLQLAVPADMAAQWGLIDTTGAKPTIQIQLVDHTGGAVAAPAANANNSIGFEIECVQDSVQG